MDGKHGQELVSFQGDGDLRWGSTLKKDGKGRQYAPPRQLLFKDETETRFKDVQCSESSVWGLTPTGKISSIMSCSECPKTHRAAMPDGPPEGDDHRLAMPSEMRTPAQPVPDAAFVALCSLLEARGKGTTLTYEEAADAMLQAHNTHRKETKGASSEAFAAPQAFSRYQTVRTFTGGRKTVGTAKSVVRYLDPDQYEGEQGLRRFLDVLRASPLQNLPIPDSFTRLDRWSSLKRRDKETIPELIIREEELYVELQQALMRARRDKHPETSAPTTSAGEPPSMGQGPPSTPSRSPTAAAMGPSGREPTQPASTQAAAPDEQQLAGGFFFEDELRGYRLLRASRISHHEKQNVLVQTSNSTSFVLIRRALTTLFADGREIPASMHRHGKIWYGHWDGEDDFEDSHNGEMYWNQWDEWHEYSPDGSPVYWQGDDAWWDASWEPEESWDEWQTDEICPKNESTDPAEVQLAEAFTLAGEANRTLRDAREAVRRVRQARGYYAPESSSGKGFVPLASSPSSSPSAGKGSSEGKPSFKGSKGCKGLKGKSKGSKFGKAKTYYVNLSCILWDSDVTNGRALTRAIIDTGASECNWY
eukprot:s1130_g12.t1